jgi:enoyl-CoA hydratase/carnithine racemase
MKTFHGVTLSWSTVDDVLEVRLHRGPCNEIGTTTLRELEQLASFAASGADGARAMLIYSEQEAGFCAGADLRELWEGIRKVSDAGWRGLAAPLDPSEPSPGAAPWMIEAVSQLGAVAREAARAGSRKLTTPLIVARVRTFLTRIHAAFDAIDMAPLTTVAAVHGVVFGGGFELALLADQIIADTTARFAFPELRLGLVPGFGGIPRLERDVGNGVVRDLLLTGRSLNAKRAHALGIVSQVVGAGESIAAARAAAKQATRFDPETVRRAKVFAKKLPRARLDEEIETFLALIASPTVESALDRFVHSTDVRPYLP